MVKVDGDETLGLLPPPCGCCCILGSSAGDAVGVCTPRPLTVFTPGELWRRKVLNIK